MLEISQSLNSQQLGYRWEDRRFKILRINPAILGMLCLQSASYKVVSGLPEDARCMGAHIDPYSGDILLKIESEEYEPVSEGSMAPYIPATDLVIHNIYYAGKTNRGNE